MRRLLPLGLVVLALSACAGGATGMTTPPAATQPTSAPAPAGTQTSSTGTRSTPTSTTSTSTSTPGFTATASDAERTAAVVPAYRAYWAAIDDMRNAGGAQAPTQAMLDTMTGAPLDYWTDTAAQWKANGVRSTGRYEVTAATARQVTLAPTGGSALVDYCVDTSKATFMRSGTLPPPPKAPERYRKGTATMTWVDGRWKLADAKESNTATC